MSHEVLKKWANDTSGDWENPRILGHRPSWPGGVPRTLIILRSDQRSARRGGGPRSGRKEFLDPPPRLREVGGFAASFLIAQPPLLARRGNGSPPTCPPKGVAI